MLALRDLQLLIDSCNSNLTVGDHGLSPDDDQEGHDDHGNGQVPDQATPVQISAA